MGKRHGLGALAEMDDDRKPKLAKGFLWGAAIVLPFWLLLFYLMWK